LSARLGLTHRHHPGADTTDLRRELNFARATDWAQSVAAEAPSLTPTQRARLAVILLAADPPSEPDHEQAS